MVNHIYPDTHKDLARDQHARMLKEAQTARKLRDLNPSSGRYHRLITATVLVLLSGLVLATAALAGSAGVV